MSVLDFFGKKFPRSVWWSGGLRFSCLGCGRCCRGEPGAIFFTAEEGRKVRELLEVSEPDFIRRFVTRRWGRPSFAERANGDCVFYRAEDSKCSIYAVRPSQCSLFPFWPSLLNARETWDRYAKNCPGMNVGNLFSAEEIKAFLVRSPKM